MRYSHFASCKFHSHFHCLAECGDMLLLLLQVSIKQEHLCPVELKTTIDSFLIGPGTAPLWLYQRQLAMYSIRASIHCKNNYCFAWLAFIQRKNSCSGRWINVLQALASHKMFHNHYSPCKTLVCGRLVKFIQVSAPTAWILFQYCIHKLCIVRIVTQL